MIRWQTDFARQQESKLRQGLSGLGIWIWVVASVVLLLVLGLAVYFANRITAPLRKLRGAAQQLIRDQFHKPAEKSIEVEGKADEFPENMDEVQTLTEVFQKMESVIRERTELLETSNRQLDQASRAKGMYLTNMSHELRTPLNAIIGFAEVLLESGKEEPLSDYQIDRLSRILKSGQHLLELINSLLDLSKIEAGQMQIFNSEFQLENLLQDVMEWLEPLLQEKSLQHELVFHSDTPIMLYSDSGKVRQVLINLLGNAIKFTESGGHIKVSSIHDVTGVSIEIQDTGCGITVDQQQQIFEVFHQVNSSGTLKGTGLGLALVQNLMKLLGGSVSLKSKYGKGSTFTLHFPASSRLKHES
jgi:signal transduction histidine kinase